MAQPQQIVVTGASGFLGRYVCERLLGSGARVRGWTRSAGAALAPGVERAIVPDLLERDGVARGVEGAAAVVHLAARVHVMDESSADPLAAFRRINVEGTRIVLAAARAAGARTFVYVSSVKAAAESSDIPLQDDVVPAPVDPYGVSKLEGEQLVAAAGAGGGMRVCVLRLPLVYGAEVKGNMRRLFELVDRGWPLPFGAVRNRRALVYAGNVAAAVEKAVDPETPLAPGPFFLTDGRDVSTAELVREIARALGRPARLVPVPAAAISAAGRAGDLLARIVPFPFRTAHADRLLSSLPLDSTRFQRITGFAPPFTLPEGLADTARWYREVTS